MTTSLHPQLRCFLALTTAVIGFACDRQSPEALALSPKTDSAASAAISSRAKSAGFRDVELFPAQSYAMREGPEVGVMLAGRGLANGSDGKERSTCFFAIAWSDGSTEIHPTIGAGGWEAESCLSVDSVVVISSGVATDDARIATLNRAASPNADVVEPIVLQLRLKPRGLSIDTAASKAASLAGATSIDGIRRALGPTR